jgi:asparagine synthetase B (glutamine-hydrolysing)
MLREAAIALGLPDGLAERPKKAAQYGSGVARALSRLARNERRP